MRINKLIISFMLFLTSLTCLMPMNVSAAPQGDPVALLQYIADNMIAGLKSNKANLKTKPSVVYNLAYKFVVPYADIDEMSKRVLPPATWNGASASQRAAFKKEFTKTINGMDKWKMLETLLADFLNKHPQIKKFF